MTFLEWYICNIPETFIYLVFGSYFLKSKFNLLLTLPAVVFILTALKAYNSSAFLGVAVISILYFAVFYFASDRNSLKVLKVIALFLSLTIIIDSITAILMFALTGLNIQQLQQNFIYFLVCVIYASCFKGFALYIYVLRRDLHERH